MHGFEPEPANSPARVEPRAVRLAGAASQPAVWRPNRGAGAALLALPDDANAGGGTLIWDTDGPLVDAVPFDTVVDDVSMKERAA